MSFGFLYLFPNPSEKEILNSDVLGTTPLETPLFFPQEFSRSFISSFSTNFYSVCLSVLSSSRSWLSVINEWWNSIILTTPCMMDFHHKETLIYPSLYDSYTLKFCKYLLKNVFRAFSLEGTVQNIWTTGALAMLSGMRWRTVLTTRAGCVFLCICKYLVVFVFVYYLHTDIYISVL